MTAAVLAQAGEDCGALDIGCNLGGAVGDWFTEQVGNLAAAAVETLAYALTWWTDEDRSSMLREPAIDEIRGMLLYVSLVLLTGGVMWQGIQMMIKRKADPLITTAFGLLKFLGWSSLGTTVALVLYQSGVILSAQVLKTSLDGFPDKLSGAMQAYMRTSPTSAPWTIFFIAGLLWVLGLCQWVLGYFRIGALVILLALMPTAAAGQLTESTKPWLPKTLTWSLTIVAYQPVSGVIFAIGFKLTGDGQDLGTALTGLATLAMATLAMPAMQRFFAWGGVSLVAGGGSGSGAGAAMAGGVSQLAHSIGSGSSNAMTRYMDQSGPAANGGGGSGAPPAVQPANRGDTSSGPGPGAQGESGASTDPGVHSAHQGQAGTGAPAGTGVTSATGSGSATGASTAATGSSAAAGTSAAGGAAAGAGASSAGGAAAGAGPAGAAVLAAEAAKNSGSRETGTATSE